MLRDEHVKMERGLRPVSYARLGDISHAFQRWRMCRFAVERVLGRLRSAIEAADLWILQEIDIPALLSHEGYAMSPARQLLFFHPRYVVRILAVDPAALLEVPLKFIVYPGSSSNRQSVRRHFT
jgi:uncharacterized protein (DUF302 family)